MTERNNNNTHKLRFPGFTGKWELHPLSFFLHEHKTKNDGKCRVHSVSVSKGVVDQIEYLGRSFAAPDTSKYNLAKPNDIIYTKSPTGSFPYGIVKMNKNPYNVIVSPLYGVYSPKNQYIGYIIDSYFESPERTNTYLSSLVQKGAKNTIQITNNTFISKIVCLPTDEAEQQKIAECLSSLDEVIVAETQKATALKDHKKGLMQQLFPQKGETTPKLRFPGFDKDWEELSLCEVCSLSTDTIATSKINSIDYVGTDNMIADFGGIEPNKISLAAKSVKEYKKHDVLLSNIRPYLKKIWFADKHSGCSNDILVFRPHLNILPRFLYLILSNDNFFAYVAKNAEGVKMPRGDKESMLNYKMYIPKPSEQQKIADCLSALDDQISAQQQKVDALKEHKRGLMQKLFPTIK